MFDGDTRMRTGGHGLEFQSRRAASGPRAIEPHAAIVGKIEIPGTSALVRIGHRTAARQPPRTGQRNGPVDTTRTGGGRHDQAALRAVELIGHLQQDTMWRVRAWNPCECLVLATGHVRHSPVSAAETAKRAKIGNALPTGLDRTSPQLLRGRPRWMRDRRWRASQASQAQTRAKQIVARAMLGDTHFATHEIRVLHAGLLGRGRGSARRQQGREQQDPSGEAIVHAVHHNKWERTHHRTKVQHRDGRLRVTQ